MINQQEFELHRSIIDWMRDAGVPFMEAMAIVSYAIQTDKSVPECYVDLGIDWIVKKEKDNE